MNCYGSGLIPILIYASAIAEGGETNHAITTESGQDILTELSQEIFTES
jgi:hypothetical protein